MFGGNAVIAGIVPIGAPFMDVVAEIEKPIGSGRIQTDRFRAMFPAIRVVGNLFGLAISPGVQRVFDAAARGAFPLGLGGQAIVLSGDNA